MALEPIRLADAPVKFDKSMGDHRFVSSGAKGGRWGPKGQVWRYGSAPDADGLWTYTPDGYVAPTPPPVSTTTMVQIGQEVFAKSPALVVGINDSGTLGTRQTAPEGYPTDRDAGFIRVGLYAPGKTGEAVLKGTPVEGFAVGYKVGGKVTQFRNAERLGPAQVDGEMILDGELAVWLGGRDAIHIRQHITLKDETLWFRVLLTNRSSQAINAVRYVRFIDPDQAISPDVFKTANTVERVNRVTAATAEATMVLETFDPRARASIQPFTGRLIEDLYAPAIYDAPKAVGYSTKADNTIHLAFDIGTLEPDAAGIVEFSLSLG